jgi:DNA polymerase III epsilon subunit-like protein
MRKVVFDLEANGLLDEATVVHCAVFKDLDTKEVKKFYGKSLPKMLEYLDTIDVLIAHNGIQYDLPLLEKLYGYVFKGQKIDTLLMSRLHDPKRMLPYSCPNKRATPHGLEAWGYRVGRGKPEHNDWENFSPEMLHRCTEDVEITELVYYALLEEGEGWEWQNAYRLTFKLFEILQKQEAYGWLVDRDYISSRITMLDNWISRIDRVLNKYLPKVVEIQETKAKGEYGYVKKPFLKSGAYNARVQTWVEEIYPNHVGRVVAAPYSRVDFRIVNLNSNQETKAFLLESGWIPKEWNYNDDGERTSPKLNKDDPFIGIDGGVGRLVAKRVQCRQRKSILEGWLRLIRSDGRIASSVANLAVTGRATHRGIVNVPNCEAFFGKQMRKCFICPTGRVLIGCDSASCQDRMLAARANNSDFTEMLLNGDKSKGTDGHSLATAAVNRAADLHGLDRITRGKGKNFNFGWKFGASDNKLGVMLKGGKAAGASVREELERVFPAQAELLKQLEAEWRQTARRRKRKIQTENGEFEVIEYYNGVIRGLDGRPVKIASSHALLVYMLQSDEAIMMSAAYNMCYNRLIKRGYRWGEDWAYVCWYHDEYTIECREELQDEIKQIAEQCIVDAGCIMLSWQL